VDGALKVFDSSTDRPRLEIAGFGRAICFLFDTTNHARSREIDGITFTRE